MACINVRKESAPHISPGQSLSPERISPALSHDVEYNGRSSVARRESWAAFRSEYCIFPCRNCVLLNWDSCSWPSEDSLCKIDFDSAGFPLSAASRSINFKLPSAGNILCSSSTEVFSSSLCFSACSRYAEARNSKSTPSCWPYSVARDNALL